ncbi:MAG TPA: BatA and WFA domain-containing protein, partial [Kofleriaceae bacterium]|nr:BatA and WFA domain-containing protein [Kofleriaceae bacterium]
MTFLHPWAFALAGLGVPLVLAYLHRKHRLRRTVASAILLRAVKDERPASARARARLRHRLSLVLIAIALGLGILGLVGPEASSGHDGRVIIVLDRSASMATSDGAGDRIAHAIAVVGELAERANGNDEVALVTAGGDPTVIASATKDHGEVAAKAATVTAGGDNRDDAVAFALADGLCRDPAHSKIVVVSDGTGLAVPPTRCPLESIAIGSDADNLGISGLSVHAVDGLGLYDIHLSVASSYAAPHHAEINLTSNGELVDVVGVDVPPRGDADRTLRVTIEHGKSITAELPGGDALALDDRAEVPLSGVGPVSVLLVTARKHSLVAEALRLHPRVTLDQAAPGSLPAGPHDLIILEDDPKSALPPSTHVVALGASPGDDAPIALGDAAAERGVVRWDFDSPWFRYVDLRDMILQSSRLVAGGRSVVDSSSGALVATAPWGEREL